MSDQLALARERHQRFSIALLDVDHFKRFNDERGHGAGDELLQAAASQWTEALRDADALGRYGGEEFIALLPGCSPGVAREIADRLRTATPFGQSCSVGVASWDGSETAPDLLARADAALYRAKAGGRDRVESAPIST